MNKCNVILPALLGLAVLIVSPFADANSRSGKQPPAKGEKLEEIRVTGERLADNHVMPEVSGAKIAVTKKTTVTKLDLQPPVINNNQRELFARSPGLLVTEQGTPSQFNFSYRGLGNPQESEYVLVLQDGLPITTDWIGFPTLYYVPLPQSIAEIQLIRGGSSLLYGPEPAPVVNFVSRRPAPHAPLSGHSEQVGGSNGLYSTFNVLQGTHGPWEFRADLGYVRSDGWRRNSASQLGQGDLYLGWRPDARQIWSLDVHAYRVSAGDPGRIGYAQYLSDPRYSPTPYNHDWVDRYSVALSHVHHFHGGRELVAKAWTAYQALDSRSAANLSLSGQPPSSTTVQHEGFFSGGLDLRGRLPWGKRNVLTGGFVVYHSDAPFRQWTNTETLTPGHNDHSGILRLDEARNSSYEAVFAENLFRFGDFHMVMSARVDHEEIKVNESVRPPFLTRPLVHVDATRTVPLFGIGFGNDFGNHNETYINFSTGWRPLRYYDVASPFSNLNADKPANPSRSRSWEAGVRGAPVPGLFYDVSVFWIDFKNRIETLRNFDPADPTAVINVNTGETIHRGFEGQISYDLLASRNSDMHLTLFTSVSLLSAKFVDSLDPAQIGRIPAFAPGHVIKFGLTWRRKGHCKVSLTGSSVASEYFQDSDQPGPGTPTLPAKIPAYTVVDLSAEWNITPRFRLLGGISNLADARYYSRIFLTGIEPALPRSFYGGFSAGF